MNVLFISPHYPEEMQDFTRGLAEVGARVYGLSDVDPGMMPERARRYLSGYIKAPDLRDPQRVLAAVRAQVGSISFDRIECLWEPHVVLAAALREGFGVPGMSVDTVIAFRDKAVMKQRIAAYGLRVPKNARVQTITGAREAAAQIGFPVVIKPIAGAGTANTYSAGDAATLDRLLQTMKHVDEISVEEYVEGEEFTYDTVAIEGEAAFESVAQYHPKPLESRNEEWISPAQFVFRDPHQPALAGGIKLGRGVLKALGMGTGFVHMEWFKKPNGEVVFGEIAYRNGGGKLMDMINYANDMDVYREWARSVCWHSFEGTPHRRYHVAMVFKRAIGQGRIARIEGLDDVRAYCGDRLVLADLLPIGHPRRNWRHTLLSDGYVLMRDVDYGRCIDMMNFAIGRLKMYAAH